MADKTIVISGRNRRPRDGSGPLGDTPLCPVNRASRGRRGGKRRRAFG